MYLLEGMITEIKVFGSNYNSNKISTPNSGGARSDVNGSALAVIKIVSSWFHILLGASPLCRICETKI